MVGTWGAHASTFLYVAGVLTLAFALPMFLAPLTWARALGWSRPADPNLAVYFGRCLGGVVCILAVAGLWVAGHPQLEVQRFYFTMMLGVLAMNAIVHIWGAVQRIQPRSETAETAVWILLCVATALFFPG